jgi:predicted dehydrogenase
MTASLPIAIAGAGLMGRWHAQYAHRCGADVIGIVDSRLESAERLAAKFPGAVASTQLEDLLQDCRPQVVHVCTPIESHARIAQAAMAAGANVIVEKRLTPGAAAARDLLAMAERQNLLLAPVHQFLFQPGFIRARQAVPALGRMLHLDAVFCSAGGHGATPARLDEIAAEILPHPLALIERLCPGVMASIHWNVIRPDAGEWRVAGGARELSVSILISLHGRPTESSFRIVTDGGVIELDLFHGFATIDTAGVSRATKMARPFRTALYRFNGASVQLARRVLAREFAYPGLRDLISEFYAAVRNGGPAPIQPGETLAVALACDAVLVSAALEQRQGHP